MLKTPSSRQKISTKDITGQRQFRIAIVGISVILLLIGIIALALLGIEYQTLKDQSGMIQYLNIPYANLVLGIFVGSLVIIRDATINRGSRYSRF